MAIVEVGDMQYHMTNALKRHWEKNNLETMKKANSDRVYIVDGMERGGKSTWAFQQAGMLDKKMFSSTDEFLKRVCFEPDDFFKAVRTVKNGVIVFDEAFRGFSSRAALSKVNKKLIQALMEMGQNNNIVFIVLPRIWLLDLYPAMLRSNGLFNIYMDKRNNKRCWRGFNYHAKNTIYQDGAKKGWRYSARTGFKGNFYGKFPGGDVFEKAYLKKKASALRDMDNEDHKTTEREERYKIGRNILIYMDYKKMKSMKKLSDLYKEWGISIDKAEISRIVKRTHEFIPPHLVFEKKVVGLQGKAAEMLANR